MTLKWGSPIGAMIVAASLCFGQTPPSFDPAALIQRAAANIERNADQLPRFTCSETLERSFYMLRSPEKWDTAQPVSASILAAPEAGRVLAWTDRHRLELAVFQGRQLFSWPGARQFEYEGLDDLPGGGASSSGEFGPFAISVFLSDADPLSFRFQGIRTLGTDRVAEYGYRVPRETSHFLIRMKRDAPVTTGFEGTFLIDMQTGDLRRLVVEIVRPPADSGVLRGLIVTDYERKGIGGREVLLPRSSTMRLLSEAGNMAINHTLYSGCKQFTSESKLSFDMDPDALAAPPGKAGAGEAPLRAGLEIRTTMVTPIDAQETFAGDPVEAEVMEPVRDGNEIVVPRGARLIGRVVRLERHFYPTPKVALGIQFDRAEFNGRSIPVSLASVGRDRTFTSRALLNPPAPLELHPDPKHVATIVVFGKDRLRLDSHTPWTWRTN